MKKILHICSDEKFIDYAVSNFKSIDNVENNFVVISKTKKLKYIKSDTVVVQSNFSFIFKILLGNLKEYDAVVFHSLKSMFKLFIKLMPTKLNLCWIGFGFDYYDKKKLIEDYKEKKGVKRFIKKNIFNLDSAYQRINYFCPVLDSEFLPVSTRLKLNAEYLDWNYGSSNALIEKLKNEYVNGDSILLGNSADPTNNHIEIIEALISMDEKREVIIPLSYSGNPDYIAMVLRVLKSSNLNYTVLKEFITQEEYFNIIKRCSFVIMNHKRQQAVGNIVIMLSLGAKVILNKENQVFAYLTNLGFEFFEKSNLKVSLSTKLTEEQVLTNKNIATRNFNEAVTIKKTQTLVSTIVNIN